MRWLPFQLNPDLPATGISRADYIMRKFGERDSSRYKRVALVGKSVGLDRYKGKVMLIVNTASQCGFTPQYKGLEELYTKYRGRGLVVLGFPSNDFGSQEPGSNGDIAKFCEGTFGVKFPMFTKTRVSARAGPDVNPLFADLERITGSSPKWNFHKYLIARDGITVESFSSLTGPDSSSLTRTIEKLLAQP